MALGQTAGCPRVNRAKKFMCSPRNTGNINFSPLVNRAGCPRVVPTFKKFMCSKFMCLFLALNTPPICIAVCFLLLSPEEGRYSSTPPICAFPFASQCAPPFVSQCFLKNTGGWGHRDSPQIGSLCTCLVARYSAILRYYSCYTTYSTIPFSGQLDVLYPPNFALHANKCQCDGGLYGGL